MPRSLLQRQTVHRCTNYSACSHACFLSSSSANVAGSSSHRLADPAISPARCCAAVHGRTSDRLAELCDAILPLDCSFSLTGAAGALRHSFARISSTESELCCRKWISTHCLKYAPDSPVSLSLHNLLPALFHPCARVKPAGTSCNP